MSGKIKNNRLFTKGLEKSSPYFSNYSLQFISITHIWGGVYKVEAPDGSVITDTYDGDMSSLVQKAFDISSTRKNDFGYSSGRLASVTEGGLGYAFEYTEKGELESVIKNNASIEHHAYSKSNGVTTVESKYPSENNAVYTETKAFDKYGRLKSISGILQNVYDLDPYWYYSDSENEIHTTMESYNRSQNGELGQSTKGVDGKDAMLAQTTDSLTGKVTKYGYSNGQLTAAVTYDTENSVLSQETFVYDKAGRLTKDHFNYGTPDSSITTDITYLKAENNPLADGRIFVYLYKVNGTVKARAHNFYMDSYKRLTEKLIYMGDITYRKNYHYDKTRISGVTDAKNGSTLHNVSYTYDAMGRITGEVDSQDTSFNNSYVYDSFGQLIRENNKGLDKTFIYGYNEIGNIVSAKTYAYTTGVVSGTPTTENYGYDGTVKDRLASFNNASVTYDANGRPVSYNGKTFAWTNGRLAGVSSGTFPTNSNSNTYTYDGYGRRTGKTLNTIILGGAMPTNTTIASTYYYDLSGRLIRESIISSYTVGSIITSERVYLYDESGVIGMICKDESSSATYYFDKNIRGDVIGIYDANGTRIVKYGYDSWGNCTILSATDYTVANANPFRYRSYYYDTETGFYYLNSRYYSPLWRRFISPATADALNPQFANGLNLYVYASNNPVSASYNNSSTGNRKLLTSSGRHNTQYSYPTYGPPTLYDALGFASNVFAIINGVKVAEYLTHIHGNPPPVSWFLDNIYKADKISKFFGYASAVVDGIDVYISTNDIERSVFTVGYDIMAMIAASKVAGIIGSKIGFMISGPAGAIVGTIAGIVIELLIQSFKEDIVNLGDKIVDEFIDWMTYGRGDLVNA